ncbi:MAG: hypothetical protein LBU12_01460 [Deltaproteobacteria bacterium]|nr:hypothetical protein [Deltaproteobacteria bacterium]
MNVKWALQLAVLTLSLRRSTGLTVKSVQWAWSERLGAPALDWTLLGRAPSRHGEKK